MRPARVAIVSLLFNWPAKGGGNTHTVELAAQLSLAGLETRHFFARFAPWDLGNVTQPTPCDSVALEFVPTNWNRPMIMEAFRHAVGEFSPELVIVTDAWNFKPWLAEAISDFPYVLRFDAMEGLCPLNNIRLAPLPSGKVLQCPKHQLAAPEACLYCTATWANRSGSLHLEEKCLSWSDVARDEYLAVLHGTLMKAEAALVVNPLIGAMIEPYASRVEVVPCGVDTTRFQVSKQRSTNEPLRLLFMGNPEERIKGFKILEQACETLAARGERFELWVTDEPVVQVSEYRKNIGWQTPAELSRSLASVDVVVLPSICQDAMPVSALESMASGTPVVASRIGGLQFSVLDGVTGLLFEPGDDSELAARLKLLLDDRQMVARLGATARMHIQERYAWPRLIQASYLPLFERISAPTTHGG